jgi:hypothetical protein
MTDRIFDAEHHHRISSKINYVEWYRFIGHLMHNRITKLNLPGSITLDEPGISEFLKLLDVIGANGKGLRFFDAEFDYADPDPILSADLHFGQAFFRVLPQLKSLQIVQLYGVVCNDWALKQFALHGANLV